MLLQFCSLPHGILISFLFCKHFCSISLSVLGYIASIILGNLSSALFRMVTLMAVSCEIHNKGDIVITPLLPLLSYTSAVQMLILHQTMLKNDNQKYNYFPSASNHNRFIPIFLCIFNSIPVPVNKISSG